MKNEKLRGKIKIIIEFTKDGYSAYADDINVVTTAESIPELYNNLIEAINLYYQDEGKYIDSSNLKLEIDLQQFFKHYRVLNAKFLAEWIGMNPALLSQYVQGKKKPSEKQTERILKGIHSIGHELASLALV